MCRFVSEACKENYLPLTIRQLLAAFQRTLQTNKVAFNVFDKSNLLFSDLRNTLDVVCIDLREKGVDYM